MKFKITALILTLAFVAVTSFGVTSSANAHSTAYAASGNTVNVVTDYGANGSDTSADTTAIQNALNYCIGSNEITTVIVPSGTYYVSGILKIYSNTYLKLAADAKILRTDDSTNILQNGIDSGMSSVAGYSYSHDITIEGGIFDGNTKNTKNSRAVFKMLKMKNFKLLNSTITNVCGTHFIIIDGSSDVTVEKCTFSNFKEFTGTAASYTQQTSAAFAYRATEALHTDFVEKDSVDKNGLPCKNITVTGCTFSKCTTGIGTHHVYDYMTATNISVTKNKFNDCYFYCMDTASMSNYVFSNNTATNTGGLVFAERTSGVISNNTLTSRMSLTGTMYSHDNFNNQAPFLNAIRAADKSDLTISGNTISSTTGNGIYILDSSKFNISNTKISKAKMNGIMIFNGSTGSLTGNTVDTSTMNGISVRQNSTVNKMTDCVIKNSTDNAVFITDSTVNASFNTISKSGNNGFSFSSNGKGSLDNNDVSGCASQGFYIAKSSNITADANYVHNNSKNAFMVTAGAKATINNNNIAGNTSYDLLVSNKSTGIVFKNNGSDKKKTLVESGSSATISGTKACLKVKGTFSIPAKAAYTGSQIKPTVTSNMKKDTDFSVSYGSNVNPGVGWVRISGKGNYAGSFNIRFTIENKIVTTITFSAITSNNLAIGLNWNLNSYFTGYQVMYSPNADMSNSKTVDLSSTTRGYSLSSLTNGATYYFKIRGVKGSEQFAWSAVQPGKAVASYKDICGDANMDGKANAIDVLTIKKYIVGLKPEISLDNADCYSNGVVNAVDLLLLKKHIIKFTFEQWK